LVTITKKKNHSAKQEGGKMALSSFNWNDQRIVASVAGGFVCRARKWAAQLRTRTFRRSPLPLPLSQQRPPPPHPFNKTASHAGNRKQETGNRKGRRPPKEGAAVGSNCASITTVTVQRGSLQLFHDRNCLQKLRKRIHCLSDSRTSSPGGVFLSIIYKTEQRAHQRKTLQNLFLRLVNFVNGIPC